MCNKASYDKGDEGDKDMQHYVPFSSSLTQHHYPRFVLRVVYARPLGSEGVLGNFDRKSQLPEAICLPLFSSHLSVVQVQVNGHYRVLCQELLSGCCV